MLKDFFMQSEGLEIQPQVRTFIICISFALLKKKSTVNSENFAMVLCSQNFADAGFHKNKTLAEWQNYNVDY